MSAQALERGECNEQCLLCEHLNRQLAANLNGEPAIESLNVNVNVNVCRCRSRRNLKAETPRVPPV